MIFPHDQLYHFYITYFAHPFDATFRSMKSTREVDEMTKVLVLYYSSYGHVETMALALASLASCAVLWRGQGPKNVPA